MHISFGIVLSWPVPYVTTSQCFGMQRNRMLQPRWPREIALDPSKSATNTVHGGTRALYGCAGLFTGIPDRRIIHAWANGSDIPSTLGAGTNPYKWKPASQPNGWNGAGCRALLWRTGSAADHERMCRPQSRFRRPPTLGFTAHDEQAPFSCSPMFFAVRRFWVDLLPGARTPRQSPKG